MTVKHVLIGLSKLLLCGIAFALGLVAGGIVVSLRLEHRAPLGRGYRGKERQGFSR